MQLGRLAEGYSGSDIAVIVREALMEPLRKCQQAKQFAADAQGMITPCEQYPNCPRCVPDLSGTSPELLRRPCASCGAVRMTLYEVPSDRLKVPPVTFQDFLKALRRGRSSVAQEELTRFVQWTEEFGQEG